VHGAIDGHYPGDDKLLAPDQVPTESNAPDDGGDG
jgi:hypothetical protein